MNASIREERPGSEILSARVDPCALVGNRLFNAAGWPCDRLSGEFRDVYNWLGKRMVATILAISREGCRTVTAADEQDKPSDVQSKDAAAAGAEPAGASSSAPRSLPTADFLTLVSMFSTQAMVALGLLNHPASGKPEPNLELAKHFIDLLGVVEEKSRGNLDAREKALLEGTLYDLRMTWVQKRTG